MQHFSTSRTLNRIVHKIVDGGNRMDFLVKKIQGTFTVMNLIAEWDVLFMKTFMGTVNSC